MKKRTKLMERLFSDSTPSEFKESINEKVKEAKETGASELIDGNKDYQFAELEDGTVLAEDKENDEVTKITVNSENTDELNLEVAEPPKKEVEAAPTEEIVTASKARKKIYSEGGMNETKSQPDVQVEVSEGTDGKHIADTVPEVDIKIDTGVDDKNKAGLGTGRFSVTLTCSTEKQFGKVFSAINKVFSETTKSFGLFRIWDTKKSGSDKWVTGGPYLEEDEEVAMKGMDPERYKFKQAGWSDTVEAPVSEEILATPKTESDEELAKVETEIQKLESDIKELEETQDPETAEKVMLECNNSYSKLRDLEAKGKNTGNLKRRVLKYSEFSNLIISKKFSEGEAPAADEEVEVSKPTSMKSMLKMTEPEVDIAVNPNETPMEKTYSTTKSFAQEPQMDQQAKSMKTWITGKLR